MTSRLVGWLVGWMDVSIRRDAQSMAGFLFARAMTSRRFLIGRKQIGDVTTIHVSRESLGLRSRSSNKEKWEEEREIKSGERERCQRRDSTQTGFWFRGQSFKFRPPVSSRDSSLSRSRYYDTTFQSFAEQYFP